MAVRTKEELMERIRGLLGERTDDDALSAIEDFNDTVSDYESRMGEDWKSKYEESERSWRQRYRDRFFQAPDNGETSRDEVVKDNKEDLIEESKVKDIDDLFEERKDGNSGY